MLGAGKDAGIYLNRLVGVCLEKGDDGWLEGVVGNGL